MSHWQPATRRTVYRLAIITAALGLVGMGALTVATTGAGAQADVGVDGLTVPDVNRTVSGNVSDVRLAADLTYSHDVADADRRIVKLQVGPNADNLKTIGYVNQRDPNAKASGTVTLEGSVLEHAAFAAGDVDPERAGTTNTTMVVRAVIEIHRPNGETVTASATDTATLTLTDDADLTATINGSGALTVETGE